MQSNMLTMAMFVAISPQLLLAFGIVLSLLLTAWRRSQGWIQSLTVGIFLAAIMASLPLFFNQAEPVTSLLKVDGYSVFTFILICFSGLTVALLSGSFLKRHIEVHDEYYILLQLVIFGGSILVISDHFASLFLGFELLSLALVGLVGFIREGKHAVETGFKYLILSATASSFMLLGIAFIYSQTGNLHFTVDSPDQLALVTTDRLSNAFHGVGTLLFFAGMAFKLSLVPFHFWTPDVYQGAPTPITMLMATVSKVAMFTALMKCLFSQFYFYQPGIIQLVSIIAVLSMIFGNVLALKQVNLKRLLGYSSIAHMGYLLIVLIVTSQQDINFAWQSALFYLTAYVLASLSIFMVMMLKEQKQELTIASWQGLFWQSPLLASLVILSVLSLAGIPLTMGFIGKFYLLTFASQEGLWWLIAALIAGSGISLFYYLRIIFSLFAQNSANTSDNAPFKVVTFSPLPRLLVTLFAVVGLFLGIYPDIIMQFISQLGDQLTASHIIFNKS